MNKRFDEVLGRECYAWQKDPPVENGVFFYTGPVPSRSGGSSGKVLTAIMHIETDLRTSTRVGWIFQPTGGEQGLPVIFVAPLRDWKGEWAGPDFGLLTVVL